MLSPSTTTEPGDAPIIQPIVTGEALAAEARNIFAHLGSLSSEQLATNAAWTAGIIIGAIVLLWLLRWALRFAARLLSPKHDKASDQAKEARKHVGGWTMIAARFVIGMLGLGLILYIWGFDVRTGALGQVLAVFWRAGLIIMFAVATIEIAGYVITRVLHRGARYARDLRRASQLRTLAPVLKGVTTTVVAIIATMMALSQFGVDVGPLIAGAGILGLAIGFGAQTIVKDFLTGIFLILEDTVSIGDIISIGEFGGVVEDMSLRTIKLRDFDGTLHIFPYSEAMVIHNKTKSFSFAVFDLSIDYNSDIASAIALMTSIGAELREDPTLGPLILEDIEVVGVDQLADSAVMLKARIKTLPGKQWGIRREYLQRIKLAFDANGIEIPFPHMKMVPSTPISAALPPRAAE